MSKRVMNLFESPMLRTKPIPTIVKARINHTTGQHLKQHTLKQKLHLLAQDEWSSG